jgi:hypothetical protein
MYICTLYIFAYACAYEEVEHVRAYVHTFATFQLIDKRITHSHSHISVVDIRMRRAHFTRRLCGFMSRTSVWAGKSGSEWRARVGNMQ